MGGESANAYVVAVTRWGRPLEQELATFAKTSGLTAYDMRLRLTGELPVVFERTTDPDQAKAILKLLRDRDHGAVACDVDAVASSDELVPVRSFELEPTAVVFEQSSGQRERIEHDDVLALIRAMHLHSERTGTKTQVRQLSLGRAALTGGLAFTKKVTKETRSVRNERQQVLYLFRRSGGPPVLLEERGMRYGGLGRQIGPSAIENFSTMVSLLRSRTPESFFDERLALRPRRKLDLRLSGPVSRTVASSSNVWATDLAAHLLVVAFVRNQL